MKKILFGNLMSIITFFTVIFSQIYPFLRFTAKWIIYILLTLLITFKSNAQQLTENFNETTTSSLTGGTGMPTSYATGNYVLASGTWGFKNVQNTTNSLNYHSSPNGCQIGSTSGSNIISPLIANGGIGTISFWASSSTGAGSPLQVGISTDGGINFIQIGSSYALTTTSTLYNCVVNNLTSNLVIRFFKTSTVVYIDDITVTAAPSVSYYWNGSNTTALNNTWNNTNTNWSSPSSQSTLNAIWPISGTFSANFNSATNPTSITIPSTISTIPNNINIGSNFYTFTSIGTSTGSIASPINLNANFLTLSPINTANLSLSGIISGTGGLSLKGGGVGNEMGGCVILNALNTFSGNTAIGAFNNNAVLQIDQLGAISNSTISIANNSQLFLNGVSPSIYSQGLKTLTLNGTGNAINIGAMRTANNNIYTWNGALIMSSNTSINVGGTGILNLPGIISLSSNGLTKEGTGTLVINSIGNSGTGLITLNNGTLKTTNPNVLFNGSGLLIGTGSTFDLAGNNQLIGALSGTGTITSSNIGNPNLTIGSDNTSTTFAGLIQNGSASSLNLIKSGSGTLILSGNLSNTGTTTINTGIIKVNGSLPVGNNLSIAQSGTLTGIGSVNGSTIINGLVSPSDIGTIGNLSTGNTTFSSGGTYHVDINSIPSNGTIGVNWDNLVCNSITNNATALSKFNFSINGTISGFSNSAFYTWSIGSYSGIAPSIENINLVTTGLTNNISGGTFRIAFINGNINLMFTPLTICLAPISQPTGLEFTYPSSSAILVSFTIPSVLPSGYLVIRTLNNTVPTSPIDGISYSVHSANLGGYIELDSNSATFTSSSLNAGTNYWYWIYSYNNLDCSGGPIYQTINPLSAMTTTVVPSITLSKHILSSFCYSQGYGPSGNQLFNITANNLSIPNGSLLINGTTNYLVSSDNISYNSSITIPFNNFNLASTPIFVRLKAGLIQNNYNGDTIFISGGGANSTSVQCNGVVTSPPSVLAGWEMYGQYLYGTDSLQPTTIDTNVTVIGLVRGSGVGVGGSSVYNAWGGNGFTAYLPATGITNNVFYTFSIKCNIGYSMSLAAITPFYYRRSGTGPTSGLLQYQLDNNPFVSFDTISFPSSLASGALLSTINLNNILDLQTIASNTRITFRLIPYNASGSIGTFYIFDGITGNDLSIIGSTIALKPIITSNLTANSVYGTNSNYQIIATNANRFGASNLPIGLTIDSLTGIISVSNTTLAGNFAIIISATNQSGSVSDTLNYIVTKAPLRISAANQIKPYGSEMNKDSLQYSSIGLLNNDKILGMNWISDGILYSALPNSYSLIPSLVYGVGIENYTITYESGLLTVNKGEHGVWVGVSNSNLRDSLNWEDLQIIVAGDNLTIHPYKINYPSLKDTISLNNLNMDSATAFLIDKNAVLQIMGLITNSGLLSIEGTIEFNGKLPQTISLNCFSNNTIQNLSINNAEGVTVLGALKIKGTVKPILGTLNTSDHITLLSDSNSTARISSGIGNYLNGKIKVERYITPKSIRKYSFIGSSVAEVSFRNSWQQQIYITGNGIGGQTCGSTFGNGGNTDKYNSNGFDKTLNNTPSLYTYSAVPINGSRWTSIINTDSINLIPGVGYKVNIRGNRNGINSCDNQLNQILPNNPDAVVISATGRVNMGNIIVPLNDTLLQKYTLIANPYPSQISFTSLHTVNNLITNKYWSYSPFGNGNYTTCCEGVYANQANGFNSYNGDIIMSGQAFFVEAKENGNLVFSEMNKIDNPSPNTNYFGITADNLIRISLFPDSSNNTLLDEIVLRFNQHGTKSYNNNWDAISFNCGNQVLSILKGDMSLSIATFPDYSFSDTVLIGIKSNSVGSYILSFNNLMDTNSIASVTMYDKFLNLYSIVSKGSFYSFNITNDTLSKGNNRFQLIVNQWPLAINKIILKLKENQNGVSIKWQVSRDIKGNFYQVERSNNGVNFTALYQVKSDNTNYYSTVDNETLKNKTYYRIKATELDGTIIYSPTQTIISQIENIESYISVFPNPVHDMMIVKINSETFTNYRIEINTIEGKKIFSENKTLKNELMINTQILSEGIYYLIINDNNGLVFKTKFIKF